MTRGYTKFTNVEVEGDLKVGGDIVLTDDISVDALTVTNDIKLTSGKSICDAGGDEMLKFTEAATPVTYVSVVSGNTGVAPQVAGAGETNTDLHLHGAGTGNVRVSDGTDPTKALDFELAGATTAKKTTITASQTDDRVITLPDATCTLAPTADPRLTFSIGTHDYGAAAVDWTLSAAELLKTVHKPTNANGAVNAIVAVTAGIPYIFINATGQALTVKTPAGTGISIASTKAQIVMSDGTNVIALAAVTA